MKGVNLNKDQKKIFNYLTNIQNCELVNIDALIDHVEKNSKKKVSRHAMIVRMKYLAAKLAQLGWILSQESKIGRGATTYYKATKTDTSAGLIEAAAIAEEWDSGWGEDRNTRVARQTAIEIAEAIRTRAAERSTK